MGFLKKKKKKLLQLKKKTIKLIAFLVSCCFSGYYGMFLISVSNSFSSLTI